MKRKGLLKKGLAVTLALTMTVPGSLPVSAEETGQVQENAADAVEEKQDQESGQTAEEKEVQDTEKEDADQPDGTETGTEEQSDLSALQEENPAKEEITAQEESQAAEVSEFKGKGTAEDPYQIGTAEELKLVATKVNAGETGYASAYYKQTADIDLQGSGTNQWTPIGQEGKPFTGTYDGAGYTIQNLYKVRSTGNSSKNHYYGLFGITNSPVVITNVTVENVTLKGSQRIGAIVGEGSTGKEISNCTVKGDIKIDAYWYAGVIGGYGYINKIENCTVAGNPGSYIKGNNGSYIGGIWGFRGEGGQTITNCHVSGINISGDDRLGGICGIAHYGNKISDCTVSDCTITANNVPDRAEGTVGLIAGANVGSQASPSIVVNNTVENTTATEIDREITTHTGANNHQGNPLDSSVVGTDVTFDEQGKILSGKFEHVEEGLLAEGSVLEQNPDGSFTVKTEEEANAAVQVGGKYYSTLQEAIEAAQAGETILFLKDMTENVSVPEGKKVVFDLNGKTLTSAKTLTVRGDLTVKDSTAAAEPEVSEDYKTVTYQSGKLLNNASGRTADAVNVTVRGNGTFRQESGSIVSEKNYTVAGYDKSHLVLAGGYQEGPEGGPGVLNDSVLDMEGGVVVGTDNAAVAGNGSADLTGSTTINMTGGTLIGRIKSSGYIACGIYHPQNGVLNMTGGTIYADNGVGILMRAGDANITGGTITATGTGAGYVGDNKNAVGHFGIVYDIKADYPRYEEGDKAAVGGEVKVTVEDPDGEAVHIYAGENQKKDDVLEVSGGTYNKPVDQEYCADGFVPKDNGNGTFGVEEAKVVQIGDQTYASLEKAAEAAKTGDTLTLLTNTDISAAEKALVIAEGKEITLDLAGQEIKAANTKNGRIQILGKLTLKDSKGGGRIYTETEYAGSETGYTLIETIGTFVMESGTIEAVLPDAANKGQFAVSAKDNGVVQIDGGKIEAGWYAVSTNGSNSGTSKIIVNGGELISTSDFAIYGAQSKGGDSGSVEINGGVVYGAAGGVAMKSGTLSVTGGTVTSKGQGSTGEWGDGTGGMKNAAINVDAEYGDVTAEISGGKITAEGDAIVLTTAGENKADLTVSGGEFNKPVPEEFCADSYNPVKIEDADGNITYGVADEVKIDFLGGSLRMDYKNPDGSYDFTKTSLRFGYQIKLPEGAVLESWKWDYGTSEENLSLAVKGENKVPQVDGSFVSNLVLKNAPVAKYDTLVYTALSVTYEKDGKTITVTDKTESRSVKAVAEAIVNAPNAPASEKEYAEGLLNAFNNKGWTGYY